MGKGARKPELEAPGVTLCVISEDGPTAVVPKDTEGAT